MLAVATLAIGASDICLWINSRAPMDDSSIMKRPKLGTIQRRVLDHLCGNRGVRIADYSRLGLLRSKQLRGAIDGLRYAGHEIDNTGPGEWRLR